MQRKHLVVQDSLLDEMVLTCGFNYNKKEIQHNVQGLLVVLTKQR